MHRHNPLCRLDLYNELLADYNIEPVTAIEAYVLVDDWQRDLATVLDTRLAKLAGQTFFVSGFKQARAEMAMHLDRQTDYSLSQLTVAGEGHDFSVPSVSPWLIIFTTRSGA